MMTHSKKIFHTHSQVLANPWRSKTEHREYWVCHRCGNAEFVDLWNQREIIRTF